MNISHDVTYEYVTRTNVSEHVTYEYLKHMNIYEDVTNEHLTNEYGVALASRIDKIIGLFCKRAL